DQALVESAPVSRKTARIDLKNEVKLLG
ncbi:MAG: hypothetical protein JWQ72_2185, partial [Polaromonas sp.]|nr:hypothetical protein [Polaromonas sp.]